MKDNKLAHLISGGIVGYIVGSIIFNPWFLIIPIIGFLIIFIISLLYIMVFGVVTDFRKSTKRYTSRRCFNTISKNKNNKRNRRIIK